MHASECLLPLFLLLEIWNVLGCQRKHYTGSPESQSYLPTGLSTYGSNWYHKIADFVFLAFISFIIA